MNTTSTGRHPPVDCESTVAAGGKGCYHGGHINMHSFGKKPQRAHMVVMFRCTQNLKVTISMCFFPFHKEDYFFWAVFSVNVWSTALKFHRTFKVPTAEKVFCTLLLQLDVWPWRRRMMYEQSLMIEGCFFFFTSICWRGRGESFSLLTWTSEFNMFYLRVEFRTWQLVFFQWVRWGNLRLPVQVGFFLIE